MKQLWKRGLCLLLTLRLLMGFAVPLASAEEPAAETRQLQFEEIDPATLNVPKLGTVEDEDVFVPEEEVSYGLNDRVRVSIVLNAPSTLDQGYQVQGIAQNESAQAYRNTLKKQQDAVAERISREILGETLEVKWNITLAGNMISAYVPFGKIEAIKQLDDVADVVLEAQYQPCETVDEEPASPNMTSARDMVGANGEQASAYTGAGRKLAIIDTGLDYLHQSYDPDAFLYAIAEDGAEDKLMTAEDIPSQGLNGRGVYLNAKVPYAYNYVDENTTIDHTNDTQEEHGSHVAGIAAANRYIKQGEEYVNAAEAVNVVGEAPDAQVFIMKVFGSGGGAYDSDYMVAIEDAMMLGADSVNLSLGSSAPGISYIGTAQYRTIFENLVGKDIVVSISMGNNTSWDSNKQLYADDVNLHTGGSPGTYTNSIAVASVDDSGAYAPFLRFNDSLEIRYLEGGGAANNAPMTTVAGVYDFVYVDAVGTPANFAAVDVQGKVALCNRGETSFFEKANAAVEAGAVATIIVNNQAGTISMALDGYSYTNPCVSIKQDEGVKIKALAEQNTADGLTYYTGKIEIGGTDNKTPVSFFEMSSFSSWGVPGSLELKPEITAPGGGVFSLNGYHRNATGGGYSGGHDAYENMSGTSMAAPQVTGLSAVFGQYYEENNLREKTGLSLRTMALSLLMSTAVPVLEEASNNYYSLLKQGAGLANINGAVSASSYILMDENATRSFKDGKVKAELGDDPQRTGEYSYSFTLNNFSDNAVGYTLRTDLFTQALENNNTLMSHTTEDLDADISYVWELLSEEVSYDVDQNGLTEEADGQAILDKLTGIYPEDAPFDAEVADVDKDGEVTSYDAYQLLKYVQAAQSAGDEGYVLPAGGSARITVTMKLTDDQKAKLDALRAGGAYVEGFTFVESPDEPAHSIPVLAFYGSWTDASMFNASTYAESYYGAPQTSYFTASNANGWYMRYNGSSSNTWFLGNPYVREDSFPEDKLALNNDTTIYQGTYTLIRNTNYTGFAILKEGEERSILYTSNTSAANVTGAYYNTQATTPSWQSTNVRNVSPNRAVSSLGLNEGERFSFGFYALPEYYATKYNGTATMDAAEFNRLLLSDELGKGACLGYTVTVDNTAPVIDTENTKLNDDGSLTVTVSDNQYIANLRIMDLSGRNIYASVVPEQSAAGETVTQTFTFEGVQLANAVTIFVGDYACNETAMMVRIAEGDIVIERDVYVPATTLVDGGEYLIVNTQNVGATNALNRNGTAASRLQLTINDANDQFATPFIKGDTVANTAVWTATATDTGFKISNEGNYLRANGSWSVSLQIAATDSNNVWTWDETNNRLSVGYNNRTYYLRYNNNNFSINTATNSVYLFEKQTYTEIFDDKKVESLTVTPTSAELFPGGTEQLQYDILPITLADKTVTWSSSDEAVATVDENGLVTAVSAGTAVITATANSDNVATASATITVLARTELDASINAQIVANAAPKFVKIDLSDLSVTDLGDAAGAHYGGGRSGDVITGFTSTGDIVETDIYEDGYDSYILGSFGTTQYNARDGAHIPTMSATVDGTVVSEEYMSVFLASNYLLMLTAEGSLTGWNFSGYTAICYAGTDEATGAHYYYMLNNQGALISAMIGVDEETPVTEDGSLNMTLSTSTATTIAGMSSGAGTFGANYMSMSLVETEELYGLLIANTNNRRIYFVDLTKETLEAVLVAGFPGYSAITTLYDDLYDVYTVILPGEGIGGELMREAASAQKIAAKEIAKAQPAGTLNAIRPVADADPQGVSEPATVVDVTADSDENTNGLIRVSYDETLTLVSAKVNDKVDYKSESNEAGEYVLAYVDLEGEIMKDEVVVTLTFEGASGSVAVTVEEDNQNFEPTEYDVTIGNPAPEYGEPVFDWSEDLSEATATFTAENTGNEETLIAKVTSEITVEPGCETEGEITYTATVLFQGVTYTDTQTAVVEALGHSYGEPVFTWSEDLSSASAAFTCERCQDVQTVEAEVSVEITDASCAEDGVKVYTATVEFEGQTYTDEKTEAIAATGHSYGEPVFEWSEDLSAATATFTCEICQDVQTVEAEVTSEVTTAATCEAEGETTYTATVEFEGQTYTDTKTEAIEATGHSYGEPVWNWAEDCSSAAAVFTCTICGEELTVDAEVNANVTEPTCVLPGSSVYTATAFLDDAVYSDIQEIAAEALGHEWDEGVETVAADCTHAGLITYTCARCGETRTEAVDALGHTPEDVEAVAPTCTEPGNTAGKVCSVCGAILEGVETILPTGHTIEILEAVAPTCTETGLTAGAKCSVCGEILVAQEIVEALGHTPEVLEAVAPTCTETGLTAGEKCSVCGEILVEQEIVEALGHDWGEVEYVWAEDNSEVTATRVCLRDETHVETETAATTSEVTVEPTEDAEGELTYTAVFENEAFETQTKTEVLPKLEPADGLPCSGGDDCPGAMFTDMPAKDNWAHDPIDWAVVYKITAGTSDTTFSPNASCTRAQVVTFLWRAAGEPEPASSENPFSDVKEGAYYYNAVLWAVEKNITAGTAADKFSPDNTCTRAQIVTFLWRYEGEPEPATAENPFTDVAADAYFAKAVLWASENGVTAGTSDTTFSPNDTCTRAQVVTFLYRDLVS